MGNLTRTVNFLILRKIKLPVAWLKSRFSCHVSFPESAPEEAVSCRRKMAETMAPQGEYDGKEMDPGRPA